MTAHPSGLGDALPLFEALFATLVAAGKPGLPRGRRREVVDLLTRVMTDPDLFAAYTVELRSRRAALGWETELRLLKAGDTDIPGEAVLADGFGGLADDILADLATSPEALDALDRAHFRGDDEPGEWFYEAIDRETARRPDAAAGAVKARELRGRAEQANEPPRAEPRRPSGLRWLRTAVPAALAASLLLNVYLGFGRRDDGKPADDRLVASASVVPASTRGREGEKFQFRVRGPVGHYVVLLALSNESKQEVLPREGYNFIRIPPEGVTDGTLLPAEATRVVYAVTDTPAEDPVRRKFGVRESRRYLAAQEGELAGDLTRVLQETGYRRFFVGTESVPLP